MGGGYGGGGEGKGEGVLSNNSPDITASIFKMVLALGIVLSLLFAAVFLFKKFFGGKIGLAGKGQQIRVITSTYLGPKKSIAVVDVAGERIVVGVTPTHITMLTRLRNDDEFKDLLNERMTSPNNKPNNKPNNEVELNDDLWEKV
ncbi:MAG: flagellar biosynthetic protein FliO [Nitrospirae bacterium]|nr:flagellar biosynthetic protein FliO [Nitrospirota bacterium]